MLQLWLKKLRQLWSTSNKNILYLRLEKFFEMRKLIFYTLMIGVLTIVSCKNKTVSDTELNWLTIEEASKIGSGNNDKKFLVDVYTDWCGWCKVMDKKTFTDPAVIKYLNENFYVVKFNAEQKEPAMFKGKKYEWTPMGRNGVNQLGVELLQGRLSYPTIVYLNSNLEPLAVRPGYKTPEQLLAELQML